MNLALDNFPPEYIDRMSTATCPSCGRTVALNALIVRTDGVWQVGKMTKYQPLREYLAARQDAEQVRMTFAEVATILGESLPESAFKYRQWWANQTETAGRPQAAAWLDAGFVVAAVQQEKDSGWVEFVRR